MKTDRMFPASGPPEGISDSNEIIRQMQNTSRQAKQLLVKGFHLKRKFAQGYFKQETYRKRPSPMRQCERTLANSLLFFIYLQQLCVILMAYKTDIGSKQRDPNPIIDSLIRTQCCKHITESLICRCRLSH